MHDVKNMENGIKRKKKNLEIDAEFFMPQMIEEIAKKVYRNVGNPNPCPILEPVYSLW